MIGIEWKLSSEIGRPRMLPGEGGQMGRKETAIETSVFLFLIVPSMAFSFFVSKRGPVDFTLVVIGTILRDTSLVALVLFLIWRNREPIGSIGWRFKGSQTDILWGIVLFAPLFFLTNGLERFLHYLGLSVPTVPSPTTLPRLNAIGTILAFFLLVVVAVAEETVFRGYLILRLETLIRSRPAAALLSAAIFAIGHGYEGTAGVATVFCMGVIFAFIYLWRKSLAAPMIMHFLHNFLVIVLLPLLSGSPAGH